MKAVIDLANQLEDNRIEIIGRCVAVNKQTVAVIMEDEPAKIQRYKNKLNDRHPGLIEIEQLAGVVAKTVTLRIKPKVQNVAGN